jgi:hypothetical protein
MSWWLLEMLQLYKINECKNQNPHQIDEMPVQAGDLDMLGNVATAAHGCKHGGIIDNPAGHVHAVKPSENKKRRGEQILAER